MRRAPFSGGEGGTVASALRAAVAGTRLAVAGTRYFSSCRLARLGATRFGSPGIFG